MKLKLLSILITILVVSYTLFLVLGQPSNDRSWLPELTKEPYAEISNQNGIQMVRLNNIRRTTYNEDSSVKLVEYYDEDFNVGDLAGSDYFVTPFGPKGVAHTILSFHFDKANDSRWLALSVEARKEVGEDYGLFKGMANQYELIYIWADEADVVKTRVQDRGDITYRYNLDLLEPEKARQVFLQLVERTNELADKPEFYHTIWNNCTIDLWQQLHQVFPDTLPWTWSAIFPEKSAQYLAEIRLISNPELPQFDRQVPVVAEEFLQSYSGIIRGYSSGEALVE